MATKLDQEEASVQVATLLTVIGAEAHKVFSTFHWTADEDKVLEKVLDKFAEYCQPRVNVPFERFKFNSRSQGAGEPFDLYVTTLRQLAARCNFAHVTEEDLLRDRIIFGIHNLKLKERLLREADLMLSKCLEICRAAELSSAQLKEVTQLNDSVTISAVNARRKTVYLAQKVDRDKGRLLKSVTSAAKNMFRYKMACPAWGKQCSLCKKFNHLRAKCYKLRGVQSLATETTQEPQELQFNEKEREKEMFSLCRSGKSIL